MPCGQGEGWTRYGGEGVASPGRSKSWQQVVVRHTPRVEERRTHVRELAHRGERGEVARSWWWDGGQKPWGHESIRHRKVGHWAHF